MKSRIQLKPVLVVLALASLGISSLAASEDNELSVIKLRTTSVGDEAFTEPIETIDVASPEIGIIQGVHVKRGDRVEPQQLLFALDMRVLEASLRLAKAKANSKARLRSAQVEWENKAKRHRQLVALIQENAGSPREVEQAEVDAQIAKQNVEAIYEEIEQFRLEAQRIESQMEQRRVRSPISGVVTEVQKKIGEHVSGNNPSLATIVRLDTLRVVFYLPTARARKITDGDVAEILLTETNQKVEGLVDYVAPVTNADSGRVRVDVLVDNPKASIRSGVRCRLLQTSIRQSMSNRSLIGR